MSGRVVAVDPRADRRWDEFVVRAPDAGVFHSAAWLEVLQRTYGYQPEHLAYEVDGALEGILPLLRVRSVLTGARLVSLPYSGPAGPVGSSDDAVDALVAAAVRLRAERGCAHLNLQVKRRLPPRSEGPLARTAPIVCSSLSLGGDPSVTWARLRKTLRWEIRRAGGLGVSVSAAEGGRGLDTFYRLHIETHRRHGLPPQPSRLFELMQDILAPRGMFRLLVASLNGRPIHAAICLTHKDVCSLLYTGADDRFRPCHPGQLVHWTAISQAAREGYRHVDFLQSDVGDAGLRWYKRSFGCVESPVTFYFDPRRVPSVAFKNWLVRGQSRGPRLVRAAVRQAPAAALRLVGTVAFKHLG